MRCAEAWPEAGTVGTREGVGHGEVTEVELTECAAHGWGF